MRFLNGLLYGLERQARRWWRAPRRVGEGWVLLASFPKSGNTWVRFIVSNVSRILGGHQEEVDFHTLPRYAPPLTRRLESPGTIRSAGFPLFLTTHLPYMPVFDSLRPVLVVRDPMDVMVSYYHHRVYGEGRGPRNLRRFVRHWRYGIPAWREYHRRWLGLECVRVRYEDLLTAPLDQVRRVMDALDVPVPDEVLTDAVERSSKENMRRIERERGRMYPGKVGGVFVRGGRSGEGRQTLSLADQAFVRRECGDLLGLLGYAPQDGVGRSSGGANPGGSGS